MKFSTYLRISHHCGRQIAKPSRACGAAILGRLLLSAAFVISPSVASAIAGEPENHLFILSGQSNMTAGLKSGFARGVEMHFSKENVTVVHHCKPGRGIRFWDKDYKFPEDYQFPGKGAPSERTKLQHGEAYAPLIKKVRDACKGKSYTTITLIWMQGESDGMRGLGEVYEESFLRLLERLKTDMGWKEISFVIGRINSAHLKGPTAKYWLPVREAQVQLAENADRGDWINTDDLSEPDDGVHFPQKSYPVLGSRFAAKAIDLLRKTAANPANATQGDDESK